MILIKRGFSINDKSNYKKIIINLLALIGIICLIYFIYTLIIGVTIGNAVFSSLIIGLVFISPWLVNAACPNKFKCKSVRLLLKVISTCINLVIVSFIIIETLVVFFAVDSNIGKYNYIVILGSGLKGERPALELKMRLNKALELIKTLDTVKIILSGGQGPGETISEAEAMKRYLTARGVNEARILKEDKSTSTYENLVFSKAVIDRQNQFDSLKVAVVTSNFHTFRTNFLASRISLPVDTMPSPTPWYVAPDYFFREYFAVIKSLIFDR